jgi:hypothetical protein
MHVCNGFSAGPSTSSLPISFICLHLSHPQRQERTHATSTACVGYPSQLKLPELAVINTTALRGDFIEGTAVGQFEKDLDTICHHISMHGLDQNGLNTIPGRCFHMTCATRGGPMGLARIMAEAVKATELEKFSERPRDVVDLFPPSQGPRSTARRTGGAPAQSMQIHRANQPAKPRPSGKKPRRRHVRTERTSTARMG